MRTRSTTAASSADEQRAGQDPDLDVVVAWGAGAEGELADEQGDGEPDPGEEREPEDVPPAQAVGELGAGEPLHQPGGAEDARRSCPTTRPAMMPRVTGSVRLAPSPPAPARETPAAKKANTGTANAGGQRPPPVLEVLGQPGAGTGRRGGSPAR